MIKEDGTGGLLPPMRSGKGADMSKKLGTLVKDARTKKGLTQAALAEAVEGLTASDVSRIERGEKEPSLDVVKKMAKPLGVTQASLVDAMSAAWKKAASEGKTSAKKTGSAKKPAAGKTAAKDGELTLTATEKKLVELYRSADSGTKKAAMNLLKGETGLSSELLSSLLGGSSGSGSSANAGGGAAELLSSLLGGGSGKPGASGNGDMLSSLLGGAMDLFKK